MLKLQNRLPYNRNYTQRARELRKKMTNEEKKVWYCFLREISNNKFRVYRQRPILYYIVDFYVPKLKLVIEIDGGHHYTKDGLKYDNERTNLLMGLGLKVIRYKNKDVVNNFGSVCDSIRINLGI